MEERKTPDEWLQTPEFSGLIVIDPDGWDRRRFKEDWARPLNRVEFVGRLSISTLVATKNEVSTWTIRDLEKSRQALIG